MYPIIHISHSGSFQRLLSAAQTLVVVGMVWRRHSAGLATVSTQPPAAHRSTKAASGTAPGGGQQEPLIYQYTIERELEHSPEAFTQGLEFDRSCHKDGGAKQKCEDVLWESTGKGSRHSCAVRRHAPRPNAA